MRSKSKHILRGVLFVVSLAIGTFIVNYLWNCVVPDITGWTEINLWQTLALMVIGRILSGGFGGWRRRMGHHSELRDLTKEQKKEYLRSYFSKKEGE